MNAHQTRQINFVFCMKCERNASITYSRKIYKFNDAQMISVSNVQYAMLAVLLFDLFWLRGNQCTINLGHATMNKNSLCGADDYKQKISIKVKANFVNRNIVECGRIWMRKQQTLHSESKPIGSRLFFLGSFSLNSFKSFKIT